jgi:hypothetical protein
VENVSEKEKINEKIVNSASINYCMKKIHFNNNNKKCFIMYVIHVAIFSE